MKVQHIESSNTRVYLKNVDRKERSSEIKSVLGCVCVCVCVRVSRVIRNRT
jgi:hypothetical protein